MKRSGKGYKIDRFATSKPKEAHRKKESSGIPPFSKDAIFVEI
jgi:hypothetical protein